MYVIVQRGVIHEPANRAVWLRQCQWIEMVITHTELCVRGALKHLKEREHGQEEETEKAVQARAR